MDRIGTIEPETELQKHVTELLKENAGLRIRVCAVSFALASVLVWESARPRILE